MALQREYKHVNKQHIFDIVKDYFPFGKDEIWHSESYMKNRASQYNNGPEKDHIDNLKYCKAKYPEIFKVADNIFHKDFYEDNKTAQGLRQAGNKLLNSKSASMAELKIHKERSEAYLKQTEALEKSERANLSLMNRTLEQLERCNKVFLINSDGYTEHNLIDSEKFLRDMIRVSYEINGSDRKMDVIEVKNIVSIDETLKRKKYVLFVDDCTVIKSDSTIYLFRKDDIDEAD